ncbi:uncharacterized protein [Halyomorpha halys]|uniref:uncharacterized protein n=1 Tax=Halyomorpha halys TaxID=286706 RepID=UPI0006D4F57D
MANRLWACLACLLVASKSFVSTAPSNSPGENEKQAKPPESVDEAVRELENLKPGGGREVAVMKTQSMLFSNINGKEEHHLNKDQLYEKDGRLVARISEKVDKEGGNAPRIKTELDIPSKNIHKVLEKQLPAGNMQQRPLEQPSILEELMEWKNLGLFPEVANSRKLQPNSEEILKSTQGQGQSQIHYVNQKDSFLKSRTDQQLTSAVPNKYGLQYTPQELAEYVFWTGDERGATSAIEDLIQDGTLSREDAIVYLEEIKRDLDIMKRQYQLREDEHNYNSIKDKYQMGPELSEIRQQIKENFNKKADYLDTPPMQTLPDDDYEDLIERLKMADLMYNEYSLEEVIYQLAKIMFKQSLSRGSAEAQDALQKFTDFLENEAQSGRISRTLEKKVLDVVIASLSDVLTQYPELVEVARETLGLLPAQSYQQKHDMTGMESNMSSHESHRFKGKKEGTLQDSGLQGEKKAK